MNFDGGRPLVRELDPTSLQLIRVPAELDVGLTERMVAVIDTPAVQRLKRISQLGLVAQVYPGAVHTRFEHSLGVYRLARVVLQQLLCNEPQLQAAVSAEHAKIFLLAAMLHDVGHWPYCHPIEDMRLPWIPRHENLASRLIQAGELAQVIDREWQVEPCAVADFLARPATEPGLRALQCLLNGPVDIDKMDYLQRDSLHAGVPYGRNFDVGRLISSLRLGDDRSSIAITEKGKTAAEMMVFGRYVMFSEVYWHHAVRSATAMLQRLVYRVSAQSDAEAWLELSDADFEQRLLSSAVGDASLQKLAEGLFGRRRQLYKRFAQFSVSERPDVHAALARRPYEQLVRCSERLAELLSAGLQRPLENNDVLLDAPPVKLEVQFNLPVHLESKHASQHSVAPSVPLAEISPVVRALATDQFDNHVKRVRVFVAADRREELQVSATDLAEMLLACG